MPSKPLTPLPLELLLLLSISKNPRLLQTPILTRNSVKVPVENLLGQEDKGIYVILANFNHERWMMCAGVIRMSRLVTEECLKWSNQRLVFGKKLIEQPVIRQK
jgi:alkylation response protein AidB-like acyl-CoA dehydrogenase